MSANATPLNSRIREGFRPPPYWWLVDDVDDDMLSDRDLYERAGMPNEWPAVQRVYSRHWNHSDREVSGRTMR